jgi:hypothetical protein
VCILGCAYSVSNTLRKLYYLKKQNYPITPISDRDYLTLAALTESAIWKARFLQLLSSDGKAKMVMWWWGALDSPVWLVVIGWWWCVRFFEFGRGSQGMDDWRPKRKMGERIIFDFFAFSIFESVCAHWNKGKKRIWIGTRLVLFVLHIGNVSLHNDAWPNRWSWESHAGGVHYFDESWAAMLLFRISKKTLSRRGERLIFSNLPKVSSQLKFSGICVCVHWWKESRIIGWDE